LTRHSRIEPAKQLKRAWTKPVVEELSMTDALLKLMRAERVPAPMLDQIARLARAAPNADRD